MILFPVEGVLSLLDDVEALRGAVPLTEGQALYSILVASGAPITLVSAQRSRVDVENWLALEGFTRWVQLRERGNSPLGWYDYKLSVVSELLAIGRNLQLYVDTDPVAIAAVTDLGVPSILLVPPGNRVGRLIDTQEQSYEPWSRLVDTIETRSQARANLAAKKALDIQEV
jgi:hypothetical protein